MLNQGGPTETRWDVASLLVCETELLLLWNVVWLECGIFVFIWKLFNGECYFSIEISWINFFNCCILFKFSWWRRFLRKKCFQLWWSLFSSLLPHEQLEDVCGFNSVSWLETIVSSDTCYLLFLILLSTGLAWAPTPRSLPRLVPDLGDSSGAVVCRCPIRWWGYRHRFISWLGHRTSYTTRICCYCSSWYSQEECSRFTTCHTITSWVCLHPTHKKYSSALIWAIFASWGS